MRVLCLIAAVLVLSPSFAAADEVTLRNGDRISGKVVKMEEGLLTIQTPYADELKITWKDVVSVRSEEPMRVDVRHGTDDRIKLADMLFMDEPLVESRALGEGGDYPIEAVRAVNVARVRVTGTATLGGNSTQGNTQTKAINAATRLSIRSHRQRINLEAKYNYGEAQQHVTARNSTGALEYNVFLTPKTYLLSTGLLEKDSFQNLTLRTTLTAGVGYQFVETARAQVSAETGLGYVNEHFVDAPPTQTPSSRVALRWQYGLIPDRLTLWQRGEAYYDLAGGNAIRARSDLGVRVTLYKNLFFNLEHDLRYNSQPAAGRLPTDHAFIFGVGYSFD